MNMEIWKTIIEYPNYKISNLGNVKSLDKTIIKRDNKKITYKGKILKPIFLSTGYTAVNLYKDRKAKLTLIHHLVAEAFLNHSVNREIVIDHIDNNKINNRLDNLQLLTHKENITKTPRGTSKYTGVHFCKTYNKWVVSYNKTTKGRYKTEEEAYKQYLKISNEY